MVTSFSLAQLSNLGQSGKNESAGKWIFDKWLQNITLSSSRVKPRPARTFVWYRIVGHRTCGLNGPATGRGAMLRALIWRAFRLWKDIFMSKAHSVPESKNPQEQWKYIYRYVCIAYYWLKPAGSQMKSSSLKEFAANELVNMYTK